jgi:hypothetical protein
MKRIRRSPQGTFIYYWQRRKRGFIGIRVSHTHAWVIVGDSTEPEDLLVIGPGPTIPLTPESQTQEFREVLVEMAPQHPELERLLSGEITFETAVLSH